MRTIRIDVNENILDKVMFFLKHLPKKDIRIISEEKQEQHPLDMSKYKIDTFKKIQDPVEWQRSIRNEWER